MGSGGDSGGIMAVIANPMLATTAMTGKAVKDELDKPAKMAREEGARQEAKQRALMDEQARRKRDEEANATALRLRNQTRNAQRGAGATGRADTIVTSPLGIPGGSASTGKTLIGS